MDSVTQSELATPTVLLSPHTATKCQHNVKTHDGGHTAQADAARLTRICRGADQATRRHGSPRSTGSAAVHRAGHHSSPAEPTVIVVPSEADHTHGRPSNCGAGAGPLPGGGRRFLRHFASHRTQRASVMPARMERDRDTLRHPERRDCWRTIVRRIDARRAPRYPFIVCIVSAYRSYT